MKNLLVFLAASAGIATAQQIPACGGPVTPLLISQASVPNTAPALVRLTRPVVIVVPQGASASLIGSTAASQAAGGGNSVSAASGGAPVISKVTVSGSNLCTPVPGGVRQATGTTFTITGSNFGLLTPPTVSVASIVPACVTGSINSMTFYEESCAIAIGASSVYQSSSVANGVASFIATWSPGVVVVNTSLAASQTNPIGFSLTNNDTGQTASYCITNGVTTGCATWLIIN